MTKTKRFISFAMVMLVIASMFTTFSISASAASQYDCHKARTITVTTKSGTKWNSKPTITFKCKAAKELGDYGISNKAPIMSLKVYDHTTRRTSWYRITGSGATISSKLRLEHGRKYTITVSYIYESLNKNAIRVGGGKGWADGNWWISSTSRINSYKIK